MKLELLLVDRFETDREIDSIASEQVQRFPGITWLDANETLGIFLLKFPQHRRQYILAGRGAGPDPPTASAPFSQVLECGASYVHFLQNFLGMMKQRLSRLGEQHLFAHSV